MRACALIVIALAGCKGDAPAESKTAPKPTVVATGDAAPSGPALELVSCTPAPLAPVELAPPFGFVPGAGATGGGGGVGIGGLTGGGGVGRGTFPRVALGRTRVTDGSLGEAAAAAFVRKHENRLRYCYEQNLGRRPTLAGDTQVTLIIEPDGVPHEVIVDKSLDDNLSLCMKHTLMELKFPASRGKDRSTILQPMTFAWTPMKVDPSAGEPTAWLPYAMSPALIPTEIALPAALQLQKAIPTAKLGACLTTQAGLVRAIMRIGLDGSVIEARTGGIGDSAALACMSAALVGVKGPPVSLITEVACDFKRGDAAPWRVALDAGYTVLDTVKLEPNPPAPKAGETFLVLLDPTTTASTIATALITAGQGAGYIVAMRMEDGAPLFLLAARPYGAIADPSAPLTLDAHDTLRVCNGLLDEPKSAPFAEAMKLLGSAARLCTHKPCPTLLTITLAKERSADELAQLVAAARRSGFERIRLGSGACPQ